jgi:hypothetical protein
MQASTKSTINLRGIVTRTVARLGTAGGINDSPLVDLTNEKVYVITSRTLADIGLNSGIYTFPIGATTGNGVLTSITTQNPGTAIFSGSFDQQWFLGNAGSMYVCAPAAASNTPTLYQIEISPAGDLGTVHTGPPLATGTTLCSPVAEFFNDSAATDSIYVSVESLGKATAPQSCTTAGSGCIMSWDVTNFTAAAPIAPTTASAGHVTEEGGTSAIVVDGSSAVTGASQVYFTPLADQACPTTGDTGGCAIQASQSGLN